MITHLSKKFGELSEELVYRIIAAFAAFALIPLDLKMPHGRWEIVKQTEIPGTE